MCCKDIRQHRCKIWTERPPVRTTKHAPCGVDTRRSPSQAPRCVERERYSSSADESTRPTGYLVMDYIPGRTLLSAWSDMDTKAHAHVYDQISEILSKLHAQPLPRLGPVGGGLLKRAFALPTMMLGPSIPLRRWNTGSTGANLSVKISVISMMTNQNFQELLINL